jgi:hypothetical protein
MEQGTESKFVLYFRDKLHGPRVVKLGGLGCGLWVVPGDKELRRENDLLTGICVRGAYGYHGITLGLCGRKSPGAGDTSILSITP